MNSIPPFNVFLAGIRKSRPQTPKFIGRLLALDPGETTGWSVWDSHDQGMAYTLEECGQLETWDKLAPPQSSKCILPCVRNFNALLKRVDPDCVVMESYRVYDWKTEDHSWSDVPTTRIIGSIETRLHDYKSTGIPYYFQTAQQAKQFVTDNMLKAWGFYQKGQRHSRDSMRHALYFLLFGPLGKQ